MRSLLRNAAKNALQAIVYRGRFVWRLPASTRAAVLTFDDGPHPLYTPQILDMLKSTGVRATFFLIGAEVEKHPELVRRIVDEGHTVGGHSYAHTVITQLSPAELVKDLSRCRQAIVAACGVDTVLFRPPKGEVSFNAIRTVCRAGYVLVHWSKTFSDYRQDGTAALIQRIEQAPAEEGDILLFHDNNAHTSAALAAVLPRWQAAGLRFEAL